jgi:riboflavin synthase
MFTGIIKGIGVIESWDVKSRVIEIKSDFNNLILGESISCSGVCFTVSKFKNKIFLCNLSSETLEKTNLKTKKKGDKLNLERSLKIGDEISGHLVFGHVDGVGSLINIKKDKDSWILKFSVSSGLLKFLTEKCSISIDGISLTVNNVFEDGFDVSIVPFTWQNTNLSFSNLGDNFNIEIDMLARYVFRALRK